MKKSQHVIPQNGEWAVRSDGSGDVTGVFKTQTDAINHAREIARTSGSDVVIHGRDGRIRDKNSYGRDPYPPKG